MSLTTPVAFLTLVYYNQLKANMVITNEPGIYLPNSYGVRIEDTVLITKSGCINLTKSNKNYVIVDEK